MLSIHFRERGTGREKGREKHPLVAPHICPDQGIKPSTQVRAPAGNQTHNPFDVRGDAPTK